MPVDATRVTAKPSEPKPWSGPLRLLLAVSLLAGGWLPAGLAGAQAAQAPGQGAALLAVPEIRYPLYQDIPQAQAEGSQYPETVIPARQAGDAGVELRVLAEPSVLAADGVLRLRVQVSNSHSQAQRDLVYTDVLAPGMEFVGGDVEYAARENRVRFAIAELAAGETLEFEYSLRITAAPGAGRAEGEIWVHPVQLARPDQEPIVVEVAFWVGQPAKTEGTQIAALGRDGGWAAADLAAVYVPEGALQQSAILEVTRLPQGRPGPELQFQIELRAAPGLAAGPGDETQRLEPGAVVEEAFAQPVFLEVDFSSVVDLKDVPAGQEPYVALYDEALAIWVKQPIVALDPEANTVTVEAAHFSTWGGGLGDSLPQNGANVLLFDQPYAALFTGGAQYSIPIWTPAGRGGLAPDIRLSYSSKTVDGVLGDVQAPWVGVGWNIDAVEIVRQITTSSSGYGYQDKFALTFNGEEHKLLKDPAHPNRYYTERASFLYIERHNHALGNAGAVANVTGEWWEIVATDGTRYRLGWNEDSEQRTLMYGYKCQTGTPCTTPDAPYTALGYAGLGTDVVASRWRVDRVVDVHGNFIEYRYAEEQPPAAAQIPAFDRASYLESIRFTGWLTGGLHGAEVEAPGYEVRFVTAGRGGVGDTAPLNFGIWDQWDEQLLAEIQVLHGETVVRRYQFDYAAEAAPNANGTLTLSGLRVSGGGYSEGGVSIPYTEAATVSFGYENLPNRAVSGGQNVWTYPRLVSIHNGYGGQLSYSYQHDGRAASSWYNYRVIEAQVHSGLGLAAVQKYSYGTPVYTNQPSNGLGALVGHPTVTETSYQLDGETKILDTQHSFGTSGLDIGRPLTTDWKNPSNGEVLRRTRHTYVTDNSQAPFAGLNYRYLLQTEHFELLSGGLSLVNKTVTQRHPGTGNLLSQSEYLGGSLYRRQEFSYAVNSDPAVYILDR
ncbi:MAG: hypothetical protein KIS80_02535, partial [Anaerolineales bacterium]|nr:hypothetical protein [Anaerolineales bacterium]